MAFRAEDLEFISRDNVGWNETETTYRCPKCNEGEIVKYKDNTIGYKMSIWYNCPICGFDMESQK